jgi:hypothetical protein
VESVLLGEALESVGCEGVWIIGYGDKFNLLNFCNLLDGHVIVSPETALVIDIGRNTRLQFDMVPLFSAPGLEDKHGAMATAARSYNGTQLAESFCCCFCIVVLLCSHSSLQPPSALLPAILTIFTPGCTTTCVRYAENILDIDECDDSRSGAEATAADLRGSKNHCTLRTFDMFQRPRSGSVTVYSCFNNELHRNDYLTYSAISMTMYPLIVHHLKACFVFFFFF